MNTERTNPNAGAKKKDPSQKKLPVQVYVTGEQIENAGGLETAREIAKSAIIYNGLLSKDTKGKK